MDPEVEYAGEENKYGVTNSESQIEQETAPAETGTETGSRGLFGLGGESDPSSSSESESQQSGFQSGGPDSDTAPVAPAAGGTDYSLDSVDGGNPTGGTDYSATTALEGERNPTGGTDYSGAGVEGGNPTGGTDYSGADLGLPGSTNTTSTAPAPQKEHHHLFGL